MTLTPAMQRQLQDLYDVQILQRSSGGRRVHLPTIRALLDRRLVLEQHGFELEDKIRLHNAYPLTDTGRQAVEDLRGTTVHHASTTTDETEERGGKTWRTSTRRGFTSKTSAAQAASSY